MSFEQQPPSLANQYNDDRVLRSYLARVLPGTMLREIEPSLMEMGRLAGGDLYQMQLVDRLHEPTLTLWDAWGNRIDRIESTSLWRLAEGIATEHGVVATAYEQKHGCFSRIHQSALAYLFTPSTDIYSCPLAMTDGAARTLLSSGNQALVERAVPHLTTRNPEEFWTSGQWMTELTGGSDVALSETVAKQDGEGEWRLYGRKWFASAVTSQIALTLARPEGNPSGGRGLALFYLETRDESGRLRDIQINRLKDKLGTRKVPTAELTLLGTPAELVKGGTDGVRNIAPLLNITRLWNGISAIALMRRGLALAYDYARKRVAFGMSLSEKPLHMDSLAGLQAEAEAAFHLAFYVAELTGRSETSELNEDEALLLRLLIPVMKLTTAKQAVMVASEVLEAFGGAGYVEDTGLPLLLRDSQVLPIWEGTTNVLSLDTLRALGPNDRALRALKTDVTHCLETISESRLAAAARATQLALEHAESWLAEARDRGPQAGGQLGEVDEGQVADQLPSVVGNHSLLRGRGQATLEAGARRFALTLGRIMESALLIKHARWSQEQEGDGRATAAARRFAHSGIDLLIAADIEDVRVLFSGG